MAKNIQLQAKDRTEKATVVRSRGAVPAVLYGHGLKPQSLEVDLKTFLKILQSAGSTSLISLQVGDDTDHPVLIRDVQTHPIRGHVMHADFYQVRMDVEITAAVPLKFIGESAAIKDMGGTLLRNMDEIEVRALPQNLPHDIEIDIKLLTDFDQAIHVKDLPLSEGVSLAHNLPEDVVALVQAPRTQEEVEDDLSAEVKEDVKAVEGVEDKPQETEEAVSEPEKK